MKPQSDDAMSAAIAKLAVIDRTIATLERDLAIQKRKRTRALAAYDKARREDR